MSDKFDTLNIIALQEKIVSWLYPTGFYDNPC